MWTKPQRCYPLLACLFYLSWWSAYTVNSLRTDIPALDWHLHLHACIHFVESNGLNIPIKLTQTQMHFFPPSTAFIIDWFKSRALGTTNTSTSGSMSFDIERTACLTAQNGTIVHTMTLPRSSHQ